MTRFKDFFEAVDIFGFDSSKEDEIIPTTDENPIKFFNLEYLMDILKNRPINEWIPHSKFINEIQWGNRYGSVKLESDTGFTFFVKKLIPDLTGNGRWITKRAFQLNRNGLGGYEEWVAAEMFDTVKECMKSKMDSPSKDFTHLYRLTERLTDSIRKAAQQKFIYRGIKQLSENAYEIVFEIGNQGVEARDHKRIEQNVTSVSYDETHGTIKVTNFNVSSDVSKRQWNPKPSDLELYFLPSQDFSEICECVAVHFKYY